MATDGSALAGLEMGGAACAAAAIRRVGADAADAIVAHGLPVEALGGTARCLCCDNALEAPRPAVLRRVFARPGDIIHFHASTRGYPQRDTPGQSGAQS